MLFDIIQSYIIKGVIILLILQVMLLLQDLLYQHTEKSALEGELNTTSNTFSSDMRLAGYNSSVTSFTIAETSMVEILGDIDNNGSVEQIKYYLASMPSSSKFYLQRTVNGGTPLITGRNFRKFYITYYDSIGQITSDLAKIKSISVLSNMENNVKFYNDFLRSSWQTQIFPANIK